MRSFVDLTSQPNHFFKILPEDWRVEIAPEWPQYVATGSRVFGVKDNDKVVAGGVVFTTVSPDTKGYATIAESWFDKGYTYFGFLFVSPDYRGKGLGKYWIEQLRSSMPNQSFWLAIEDEDLLKFYEPFGFKVVEKVDNDGVEEWILTD
jgi:GNAT superfamily N-acetyltransferase